MISLLFLLTSTILIVFCGYCLLAINPREY